MASEPKKPIEEISTYHKEDSSQASGGTQGSQQDRDFVRNVVLAELKNFRDYLSSDWGGLGSGNAVNADGLFGFFAKQGFGAYYQSPHALRAAQTLVKGNDFGRIFVEAENDLSKTGVVTVSSASPAVVTWASHGLTVGTQVTFSSTGSLPDGINPAYRYFIISAGFAAGSFRISLSYEGPAVNTTSTGSGTITASAYSGTPSWSFDVPAYSQKFLLKSTGPGLVYNTLTSSFTEGEKITGGTSGATAYVSAVFPDGATTNGTLYLYSIVGEFTDTETISGSLGGAATITRLTYTRTNPIFRAYGAGGEAADSLGSIFTFYGLFDLYCPIGLFNQSSSVNGTARDVENIAAFNNNGTLYVRNTAGTRTIRAYLNGAWQDVGGGSSTVSVTTRTQDVSSTSATVDYAHGLGRVPTSVRFQANVGGQFSDCTYDGTNQRGLAWGTNQAQAVGSYVIFLTTSGGNICLGKVVSWDATNVRVSFADKVGTPTGTANVVITAS